MILSPYRQPNPVVAYDYETLMGEGRVLGLSYIEKGSRSSHKLANDHAKNVNLFDEGVTYDKLASLYPKAHR